MSDSQNFSFGKFVPGFDFLQNLAKGATQGIPQMPNLANWVAPTLNTDELQKRIDELKAVHFWLDQNSRALAATVQALEVQKMTLSTLKGMNFSMGDVANALKLKGTESMANTVMSSMQKATEGMTDAARAFTDAATGGGKAKVEAKAEPAKVEIQDVEVKETDVKEAKTGNAMADPMQWWSALTQQFQQIATSALNDAARQTAFDSGKNLAAGLAKETLKNATKLAKAATDATSLTRPTSRKSADSGTADAPSARKRATTAKKPVVKKSLTRKSAS